MTEQRGDDRMIRNCFYLAPPLAALALSVLAGTAAAHTLPPCPTPNPNLAAGTAGHPFLSNCLLSADALNNLPVVSGALPVSGDIAAWNAVPGTSYALIDSGVPVTAVGGNTPMQYGCVGDGVHDDTVCVQAAITANANGTLYFTGPHSYKVTSGLISSAPIDLEGVIPAAQGGQYGVVCTYGIIAGVPNLNLLTLQGSGSVVRGLCLQMARSAGANSAGAAITLQKGEQITVEANQINYPFGGIDIQGGNVVGGNFATNKGDIIRDNVVTHDSGTGSYNYRFGFNGFTEGAPSDILFSNNLASCFAGDPGNPIGFLILQVQGLEFTGKNSAFACNIGTEILPGPHQIVWNNRFTNTLVGDSSEGMGEFIIDTSAPSAQIARNDFIGVWSSSVTSISTPIIIRNTASGTILGLHFTRGRIYSSGGPPNLVDISAGNDISFDDNSICGNAAGAAIKVESAWASSGGNNLSVTNNRIGDCDKLSGPLVGISLPTGTPNSGVYTVLGNNMAGSATPLSWMPNGENMTLRDNTGIDRGQGTAASAASTALPFNSIVLISGSATISNFTGGNWSHQISLLPAAGATWRTATGGNICQRVNSSPGTPFIAIYRSDIACWVIK